jgi:endonuclease/exonuclease/phosphatase (EEP) superfamily protein YafD
VGFLGGVWWGFDLASNFRVQYAAVLLVSVAALAGARRWPATGVAGVALLTNLALIVPLYAGAPAAPLDRARLEVLSFNVEAWNPNRAAVIDYVAASGADIVFLHEITPSWERALEAADLSYRIASARAPGEELGTVALFPPDGSAQVLRFGGAYSGSVVVALEFDGRQIEVLGTHPPSPVSSLDARARDEQLEAIGEWVGRQAVPVVVAGDFNASTWSHGFALVTRAGLVNSQRGYGVQPSWPAGRLIDAIPIDHLVHSPELTTVARHLGDPHGSDHYPLFVTLAWARSG